MLWCPSKQIVTDLNTAADLYTCSSLIWAQISSRLFSHHHCHLTAECVPTHEGQTADVMISLTDIYCCLFTDDVVNIWTFDQIFAHIWLFLASLYITAVLGIGIFEYFIQKCGVFFMFLKEVSHQGCIYLIKNTVQIVILCNIFTI